MALLAVFVAAILGGVLYLSGTAGSSEGEEVRVYSFGRLHRPGIDQEFEEEQESA